MRFTNVCENGDRVSAYCNVLSQCVNMNICNGIESVNISFECVYTKCAGVCMGC